VTCRYLNEVDQLISYCADIHQPHQVLPDIVLVHALDVYASHSAAVISLSLWKLNTSLPVTFIIKYHRTSFLVILNLECLAYACNWTLAMIYDVGII